MEKETKNVLYLTIERINSNVVCAVIVYSIYCAILSYFLWLIEKSNWSWMILFRSIFVGTTLGLFFRYAIYPKGYTFGKRLRIILLLIVAVPVSFAILYLVMQKIA